MFLLLFLDKKSGKESKHSKFCPFLTGQGRKVSWFKILFPQLRKASFKAMKMWSVFTSTVKWKQVTFICELYKKPVIDFLIFLVKIGFLNFDWSRGSAKKASISSNLGPSPPSLIIDFRLAVLCHAQVSLFGEVLPYLVTWSSLLQIAVI